MDPDELLGVLARAADAAGAALDACGERGLAGTREGQYVTDLAADPPAVAVLLAAGLGVLSEESGLQEGDRPLLAVLDPLDGSTNASRGLPWFATSCCVLDRAGPLAALVVDQVSGARFTAVRGRGARRDGRPVAPSSARRLADAVVGVSGYPARHLGWRQFRALGAVALDLCAVASGTLDGFVDCVDEAHGGPWDYLGGLLVCREAGAPVEDVLGRDLEAHAPGDWASPVAGATPELLAELLEARLAAGPAPGSAGAS